MVDDDESSAASAHWLTHHEHRANESPRLRGHHGLLDFLAPHRLADPATDFAGYGCCFSNQHPYFAIGIMMKRWPPFCVCVAKPTPSSPPATPPCGLPPSWPSWFSAPCSISNSISCGHRRVFKTRLIWIHLPVRDRTDIYRFLRRSHDLGTVWGAATGARADCRHADQQIAGRNYLFRRLHMAHDHHRVATATLFTWNKLLTIGVLRGLLGAWFCCCGTAAS